jgi:hypothetical protein
MMPAEQPPRPRRRGNVHYLETENATSFSGHLGSPTTSASSGDPPDQSRPIKFHFALIPRRFSRVRVGCSYAAPQPSSWDDPTRRR